MPIKRLLVILSVLGALCLMGRRCEAGEPVTTQTSVNSTYSFAHSTFSVTDTEVSTITACSGYRTVYVGDPSTTVSIFYRLDGVNTNISTVGMWIPAGMVGVIESNKVIYFQLATDAAHQTPRLLSIRK